MQFTDVCFVTKDVLRLAAFYETVFGGTAQGDAGHAWLEAAGVMLVFDPASLEEYGPFSYVAAGGTNNVIIGFNVDDVDAEYRRLLTLGVKMINEPTSHPWGARSFQFRDVDGNILNFRTMLDA